nr:ribonuclease H-like domain-containing protein [Tanacetum cinerariifolium]
MFFLDIPWITELVLLEAAYRCWTWASCLLCGSGLQLGKALRHHFPQSSVSFVLAKYISRLKSAQLLAVGGFVCVPRTLLGRELDHHYSVFNILVDLRPELPDRDALSAIGVAKISHFEIMCHALGHVPTISTFRRLYVNSISNGWVSFSKRGDVEDPKEAVDLPCVELLNENCILIRKYTKVFLCLMGLSRSFTKTDVHPILLRDNDKESRFRIDSKSLNKVFVLVVLDLSNVANPLYSLRDKDLLKLNDPQVVLEPFEGTLNKKTLFSVHQRSFCDPMKSLNPQVAAAAELPILNPNEFDLWKIRIKQYFLMTYYSLWEVILNGDSPTPTRIVDGVVQVIAPTIADHESDNNVSKSIKNDRYKTGEGYHVVPLPYTGTFMPPKPDLVFNDAPTACELVTNVFNVESSINKPSKDMSKTLRSDAPIIEDWTFDFEDETEIEECRSPRDNRNKEAPRRTIPVEADEEPTSYALMAYASPGSSRSNNEGNPQQALKDKGVINSGCSRYMTGNISFLLDFREFNGGYVAFGGNPKGGKISGK